MVHMHTPSLHIAAVGCAKLAIVTIKRLRPHAGSARARRCLGTRVPIVAISLIRRKNTRSGLTGLVRTRIVILTCQRRPALAHALGAAVIDRTRVAIIAGPLRVLIGAAAIRLTDI